LPAKGGYNGIDYVSLQWLADHRRIRVRLGGTPPGMKAMLLAAGRGERMGELSTAAPKPLLRPNDEALIERQIRLLREAGITDLVVNLSYRGALIRELLGDGTRYGVAIRYSEEGEPPLETAGGIVKALPLLGPQPFLVVNADIVTDFDYRSLARRAGEHAASATGLLGTLVLVPNPAHHPGGDYGIDASGLASVHATHLTFAGISLLHPELFANTAAGRAPLRPLLDAAIAARRLAAVRHDGLWIDVGTPARFAAARRALLAC